jgi:hypothetical protein
MRKVDITNNFLSLLDPIVKRGKNEDVLLFTPKLTTFRA